jgi:hypothetical protein
LWGNCDGNQEVVGRWRTHHRFCLVGLCGCRDRLPDGISTRR